MPTHLWCFCIVSLGFLADSILNSHAMKIRFKSQFWSQDVLCMWPGSVTWSLTVGGAQTDGRTSLIHDTMSAYKKGGRTIYQSYSLHTKKYFTALNHKTQSWLLCFYLKNKQTKLWQINRTNNVKNIRSGGRGGNRFVLSQIGPWFVGMIWERFQHILAPCGHQPWI